MSTLERKQYDELRGRLAELSRSLRWHWPADAEARDGEVDITAYRKWPRGKLVLSVTVACGLRLLPVLREHGYRWDLCRADTGERVAAGHVVGRLGVEVPDLPEGDYALAVQLGVEVPDLPEAGDIEALAFPGPRGKVIAGKFPRAKLAGKSAPGSQATTSLYEVVAEFHSPPEDEAETGTSTVQLRRSANGVLTLWVGLTGAAAEGRLARFRIQSPPGAEAHRTDGFVGTDEQGVGEVSLSKIDYRLPYKLSSNWELLLEPTWPRHLGQDDHLALLRSRDAALTGRAALEAALEGLTDRLVEQLRDPDEPEEVRRGCAKVLGGLGGPKALDALAESLRNPNAPGRVREECAKALGMLGGLEVLDALAERLRDLDTPELVRRACAAALGEIGGPAALHALPERLHDPNTTELVREECAWALGKVGGPAALAALAERLRDPETPEGVRISCAKALGKLGGPKALAALTALLRDPNAPPNFREACEEALRQQNG